MPTKRIVTIEEGEIFNQLASFCGLSIKVPSSYQIDDSKSENVLTELSDKGVDALGVYDAETSEVTIFVARCAEVGGAFSVEARTVELVVLAHEWAHMIQHRGIHNASGMKWEDFDRLPQYFLTDEEDLAQKAAFMTLNGIEDGTKLQQLMVQMATKSPPKYRKWLNDFDDWLEDGAPPDAAIEWLRVDLLLVRDASKENLLRYSDHFEGDIDG